MERESFESEEIANILNETFVSIKVDREERPDIDHIYMTVCQAMTGHGGWPLTIIMTPTKEPFFAGTYFPPTSQGQMPGLVDVLLHIRKIWATDSERLQTTGREMSEAISEHLGKTVKGKISPDTLDKAADELAKVYDEKFGGFGHAPKFPTPHNYLFLLRYWSVKGNRKYLDIVEHSLDAMRAGGIYDHIGLGFSRYSTDRKWLVPHFEKMLYDNALLAFTYLEAYQATKRAEYSQTAEEIFSFVNQDLTAFEGGFYSALDADSEGVEGLFYVWEPQEVSNLLGEQIAARFCEAYGITKTGNFEGKSIPNQLGPSFEEVANNHHITRKQLEEELKAARQVLLKARRQRTHPGLDDKILTSWNGLMIAALAKASQVLQNPIYARRADRAIKFILDNLTTDSGRLLARYREKAEILGYLDDYAFLIWGLIEQYQATFNPEYLEQACRFAQDMRELFWDETAGGFFFTGRDGEKLLARPKEIYDGAMPAGNSVAALNLLRLAHLTGEKDFRNWADQQLRAFAGSVKRQPTNHTFFLLASLFSLSDPGEIVLAGTSKETISPMLKALQACYLPHQVLHLSIPGSAEANTLRKIAPFILTHQPRNNQPTAYVCKNFACQAPTTEVGALIDLLTKESPSARGH